jgi:mRNA interferase MazF
MYEPGSIVLIPFPYSDLSASKRRPVLMLTRPDRRGDFMAMPLTSKPQAAPAMALPAGPLSGGGNLPLDSWIKTNIAYCLSITQIIKPLGIVAEAERSHCIQLFCQHLHQGH